MQSKEVPALDSPATIDSQHSMSTTRASSPLISFHQLFKQNIVGRSLPLTAPKTPMPWAPAPKIEVLFAIRTRTFGGLIVAFIQRSKPSNLDTGSKTFC